MDQDGWFQRSLIPLLLTSRTWWPWDVTFNSYPSNHVSPCLFFNSWKFCRLINKIVYALKVLGYRRCCVSHSDIRFGWVRFRYGTLRAGSEIMTRWAFALLFFLWNVKVGMRVWISFCWMFWCLWEALLTFYGVVIGNEKKWHYIYILYI